MTDRELVPPPPDGFVASGARGPFPTHNGPLFHKVIEGEKSTWHAFYALHRHTNGLGIVHGGMLTAFMDGLLGATVFRATRRTGVTIHLSIDFLHMARAGEWVIGEARVTRATRDVAFAEGCARVGRRDVVRVSGVFKLMHKGA